ncbi:MAG TPA: cytochrome c biogenesis protein CcsA [Flavobacterium sp.]|nr:cytochrome c biogenesis protein CcsA [Flavobacterium sp.]
MQKLLSFLFSTRLMAILFIVFAAAMGIGTFIENDYNTDTARMVIYNAKWFEVIMCLFVVNFIGNIQRYKLYKKEKWATLILHLAFIFIMVGAFITRYISFEGMMQIPEGETSEQIFSDRTYLTVIVDGDYNGEPMQRAFEEQRYFSAALDQDNLVSKFASNDFTLKKDFNKIPFEVEYVDFIMGAKDSIYPTDNGKRFLKLVESSDGQRHEHFIEEGTAALIHNMQYTYNKPTEGAINFTTDGDTHFVESPFGGEYTVMATQKQGTVPVNQKDTLNFRSMYHLGPVQFVMDYPIKGEKKLVSNNDFKDDQSTDALVLKVTSQGEEKIVTLMGSKGQMGIPETLKLGELGFRLVFGSKVYTTPFKVQLNDFIAEKYPGSNSYKSFESQVTIIDQNEQFDARIYMNNILDYKGYRFFQASFFPDESGTVLSVNHDFWGTTITYIGYGLLYLAMLAILFTKNSRFGELTRKLKKLKAKKASLMVLLFTFLSVGSLQAQHQHNTMPTEQQLDSLIQTVKVPQEQADAFGRLVIQDYGGRMKPLNTFTSEMLRKVAKVEKFKGLDGDQVFISMRQYPMLWHNVPMINLKRGNDSLRTILGLPTDAKYASFMDFFTERGEYKLADVIQEAELATVKNQFQKDFSEVDKRIVLMSQALTGTILKIFPIPDDENNKWISDIELEGSGLTPQDSSFVYIKNILPLYYQSLSVAMQTNDYSKADELLESINSYQHKFGAEVMPTDQHIQSEILYNKYDVFKKLYTYYMLVSVLLFAVCIFQIFYNNKFLKVLNKIFTSLVVICFVLHTIGLGMRWYISGHAPWSDAYESVIYVGWATMLFGLVFGRKSSLTLASTAFVTSMILWVAHMNYFDPAIGNLEPVLDSYWLMIHVAVIVASYGPFALGMILGIVALFLMIFTSKSNKKRMELNIRELTYINEMALTVGLVLLTIGNFLGGQWANESWGRYWGWDPKETWALISIMVYAFVIHMRLVPSLRGTWIYNLFSVIAFYAILMTYFGVNFYLSGLHSYAKGDQMVTPGFVYISVASVAVLGIISYIQYKRYYKK